MLRLWAAGLDPVAAFSHILLVQQGQNFLVLEQNQDNGGLGGIFTWSLFFLRP